jgi:phytol kinase
MNDSWALLISYAYVLAVLGAAEVARRRLGVTSYVTRKLVHVGVGTWVLPTVFLFHAWIWAVMPPITFLLVNAIAMRRGSFRSIEGSDPKNYGPLFFPLSFVIVLPLYWDVHLRYAAAAGILCMAWGDPVASAWGRAFGRRHYSIMGSTRSLEGSGAMFVASLVAAAFAVAVTGDFGPAGVALVSVCAAAAAALAEAVSFWGADDLTIPLVAAGVAVLVGSTL